MHEAGVQLGTALYPGPRLCALGSGLAGGKGTGDSWQLLSEVKHVDFCQGTSLLQLLLAPWNDNMT